MEIKISNFWRWGEIISNDEYKTQILTKFNDLLTSWDERTTATKDTTLLNIVVFSQQLPSHTIFYKFIRDGQPKLLESQMNRIVASLYQAYLKFLDRQDYKKILDVNNKFDGLFSNLKEVDYQSNYENEKHNTQLDQSAYKSNETGEKHNTQTDKTETGENEKNEQHNTQTDKNDIDNKSSEHNEVAHKQGQQLEGTNKDVNKDYSFDETENGEIDENYLSESGTKDTNTQQSLSVDESHTTDGSTNQTGTNSLDRKVDNSQTIDKSGLTNFDGKLDSTTSLDNTGNSNLDRKVDINGKGKNDRLINTQFKELRVKYLDELNKALVVNSQMLLDTLISDFFVPILMRVEDVEVYTDPWWMDYPKWF